jgi:hypothetical protein
MNATTANVLRVARRGYRAFRPPPVGPPHPEQLVTGQAASDLIRGRLEGSQPTLIGRLGATELDTLLNYLAIRAPGAAPRKAVRFVTGRSEAFWWYEPNAWRMRDWSGFFPTDPPHLERFAELMLSDVPELDVLGSWRAGEAAIPDLLRNAARVKLSDLEPYYHADPWTSALEGRTVLVVHPFEASIRAQYARRELLFADQRVLPVFELKTVRAVQSIAGTPTSFRDWFDALEHMRGEIEATEFDVAIIGAGAYGLPLAAHVKRLGRHAVYLGGATQVLFGIRGLRPDANPRIAALMNEHWVRPRDDERPANYRAAEGGSYW